MTNPASPVRVDARLDPGLSRWLWLVKWLLLIPHLVVLVVLGVAFWVLTVVAFVAILVTGRYPRTIFGFNLGVLRWGWRVAYYGYSALGTDRYPPFTLADVPDYPARLDIAYPERLSRGLVLVKWWLLAIPHYLVLAFLVGSGATVVARIGTSGPVGTDGGLISLLVLFAAVGLLFTGRYPGGLFDLAVGLNRWVLRVVAYSALMTDSYPPFRLDQGGAEPAGPVPPSPVVPGGAVAAGGAAGAEDPAAPAGTPVAAGGVASTVGPAVSVPARATAGRGATTVLDPPAPTPPAPTPPAPTPSTSPPPTSDGPPSVPPAGGPPASRPSDPDGPRSSVPPPSTGRSVALTVGAVLAALGLLTMGGGAAALSADASGRDAAGFLGDVTVQAGTPGHALRSETVRLDERSGTVWPTAAFGDVRLSARAPGDRPVFVGIGPRTAVESYLSGVSQGVWEAGADGVRNRAGGAPSAAPGTQRFWAVSASGAGMRSLQWSPVPGDWEAVVMNADGSAPVRAQLQASAQVPVLGVAALTVLWLGAALLLIGLLVVVAGAATSRNPSRAVAGRS